MHLPVALFLNEMVPSEKIWCSAEAGEAIVPIVITDTIALTLKIKVFHLIFLMKHHHLSFYFINNFFNNNIPITLIVATCKALNKATAILWNLLQTFYLLAFAIVDSQIHIIHFETLVT